MSSLYRCRARVAYRPAKENKLIVFEERQIQELNVKLKWQPNLPFANADRSTSASMATNALSQSQCNVTISDPYLTGLAWPALYDASNLYNVGSIAAANNIILPPCTKEQDPNRDPCYNYTDFVPGNDDAPANWAFLILSLWYDVGGGTFGSDYYFRVNSLAISHGTRYPSVTLRGVEARSVLFNQSLVNLGFEENLPVNEALRRVADNLGYEVEFCKTSTPSLFPELDEEKRLPRTMRMRGVTHAEAMSRLINHTGGNILSLPTKEYAKKISVCARADINQGCTVFYLGKGLYEGYEISGALENSLLPLNLENGTSANDADPYVSEVPRAKSYIIEDVTPAKRKEDIKSVKKLLFPFLFTDCKPKCTSKEFNGVIWRGPGPLIKNERVSGFNLRGVAPNGTTAISFLSGVVEEATSTDSGRVTIKTDFYLKIKAGDKDTKEQPFNSQIFQESTNIADIRVKSRDKVIISQEIGTSTKEKPEFTRFYIKGNSGEFITIDPELVWKYAISILSTPTPPRNISSTPTAPSVSTPRICVKMGNSGRSTGPHLHAEWLDKRPITEAMVRKYIDLKGVFTSGYGPRNGRNHNGVDIANDIGTPMCLKEGVFINEIVEANCPTDGSCPSSGGYGNNIIIETPEGFMRLAHLAKEGLSGLKTGVQSGGGIGNGGSTKLGASAAPGVNGLNVETSFKGVPRALRIVPGRTILSFITDYDDWVESGRKTDSKDPGVWIAGRYKNWMVSECDLKWREGGLRVNLQGVSAWGNQVFKVPTFDKFMESLRGDKTKSGFVRSSQFSKTYYDYIRAPGPLSWRMEDGKDSTEVLCEEAQDLTSFLSSSGGDNTSGTSTSPSSVSSAYPTAKCQYTGSKYPKDRVNAIINAARVGGIVSKAGFAGVVGNAIIESSALLDPSADNKNRSYLDGFGRGCIGIFQWCDRKAGLYDLAKKSGKSWNDFGLQMQWFIKELQGADSGGPKTVESLNLQTDPAKAASEFNALFERAPGQKEIERQNAAKEIFNQLSCK